MLDLNAAAGTATDLHDVVCKGQSFCGDSNESQDVQAAFGVNEIGGLTYYFYEFRQPLNGPDAANDIDFQGTLSLWLTLRLGARVRF